MTGNRQTELDHRVQYVTGDFRKSNFSGLVRSKADYSALRNKRRTKLRQMKTPFPKILL